MGRASFEKHAEPGALFDTVEEEHKVKIISVVMSKKWNEIPNIYSSRKETYLCQDFKQVNF